MEGSTRHLRSRHHVIRIALTRATSRHPRGTAHPAPRHRPRRDLRVGRLAGRHDRRARTCSRPLRDAPAPRAGPRAERRRAGPAQHRLHQHHSARARALVPRERGHRATHPFLHPLERRRHGLSRQPARARRRRAHRHLPVSGQPLRGRLQPLLPRPQPPRRRRPGVHPGPRGARHLRALLPRGPPRRGPARPVPSGALPRRRQGPVVLPPPAAHARLLGAAHRLDGSGGHQLDLSGPVQSLPAPPRHQGHQRAARLDLPRRRRDGRAGVPRSDRRGRPRGARQPHLRRQLQPAAARRPGPRQRQDHPGAGVDLPRRRLERHQGRVGTRVGRPPRPRHRRRARQPDEQDPRRGVPDALGRVRRVQPRRVLRCRPAPEEDGRAPLRRADRAPAARRPRLPQGLCRVRGGPQPHGPADGHPRPHHQGLAAGVLPGPQRHAPDEEAHQGRPQGLPRPAQHPHLRRADRRRRPRAVLPPRRRQRGDPVHAGPSRGTGRLAAAPHRRPHAVEAARGEDVRRAAQGLGQAGDRHDDGLRPTAARPHEGPRDRSAHRADRTR